MSNLDGLCQILGYLRLPTVKIEALITRTIFLIGMLVVSGCSGIVNTAPTETSMLTGPLGSYAWVKSSSQDSDSDGVPDNSDDCSQTRPNALVNHSGCEIVTGVIEGLKFAPDEVELTVESRIVLGKLVDSLVRYPNAIFAVEGHTDNRGSAADNLELSKRRVNAVVAFMVEEGIRADQIKPFAFGESRPRAPNETLEGRERNRRIEINVIERLL